MRGWNEQGAKGFVHRLVVTGSEVGSRKFRSCQFRHGSGPSGRIRTKSAGQGQRLAGHFPSSCHTSTMLCTYCASDACACVEQHYKHLYFLRISMEYMSLSDIECTETILGDTRDR